MPASIESARMIIVREPAYPRGAARLACGIRPADKYHVLVSVAGCLGWGRAVGDAAADQLLDSCRVETAVGYARGDDAGGCA